MSACIIELSEYVARRSAGRSARSEHGAVAVSASPAVGGSPARGFHFWSGASGRTYVHSVFGLLDCPPIPPSCYALVRRAGDGRTELLAFGKVEHTARSLNLAEIRHRGAQLGANEAHVYLLSKDGSARAEIYHDLLSGGGQQPGHVGPRAAGG